MRAQSLNDQQRSTLELIGAGDDLSSTDRKNLRITARTLASRGLVKVRRADGKWQAMITEAGRHVLDRDGTQPGDTTPAAELGLAPRQQRRTPDATTGPTPTRSRAQMRPAAPGARRQEALSLVERLVRDRRIVIANPDQSERGHWRKTIHYAKRYKLVLEGHYIECTGTDRGDLTIMLVTGVHPNAARKRAAALTPVPIPQRLDRLHPVVAQLRDDAGKLAMPKQLRHRSLLLFQALAAAAVERGWQVSDRSTELELHYSGGRRQLEHRDSWIWVEVDGYSYPITIDQEFPQTLDPVKSQTLKIELPRTKSGSRWRWADRKTSMLEDRLAEVLEGLASRSVEDRERTSAEAREVAERQFAQERAETDARSRALQHFYTETLYQQVSAFERSRAISAYCDEIEQQIAAEAPATPELDSAVRWLEWARSHAADIDPLQSLPTMPTAPLFTPEQLAPHLEGVEPSELQGDRFRSAQSQGMDPELTLLHLRAEKSSFRRWHPHV